MARITLDHANTIAAAALRKAAELALKPLGVVVLDAGGHVICAQRQDGASHGRLAIATGKASGALFLGMSSRRVGQIGVDRPAFMASLGALAPHGVVPVPGAVIVVDADGTPLGAVGISGDTSDHDEACALAGIAAAGLSAQSQG